MTLNEYQRLAARTIRPKMGWESLRNHALFGMASEVGELHGLYQKGYQGHAIDPDHAMKEVGDLLWFVAEYCTAMSWDLDEVGQTNISKLIARYPDGFDPEKSLHRREGDV